MIRVMLHGRDGEQAAVQRLLESARAGLGGVLVLRGDPGIGKSALLAAAVAAAAGDFRVLRAVGVEAESGLAYATLHQLLHPVLDGSERLPATQADALRAAVGLREADVPDRFLVGVAVLTLLSEVAGERPVLCVVDDAQLADRPSMEALAFVARRLETDPVAMLVAVREGEGRDVDTTGMPELRLSGLDPPSSVALLDERCGARLAVPVGDTLARSTGGNPLALIQVADSLTERQLAGRDPLPEALPLPGALEPLFLERIRRRPPEAQTLLLLAAAEGSGYLGVVGRAASLLGLDPLLLESAELDDLLVIDGPALYFRHPLVRSAAYQAASPSARRAAHLALAEALETQVAEADRRAWHRAQAAVEPDEDVAAELEHSAKQALRRSGHAAAAAALERAAELSPSVEARVQRLLGAADAFWRAGDAGRARAALDTLERLQPGEAAELDPRALRGSIELHTGVPGDALAILLPAGREAVSIDPDRAVRILVTARQAAYHAMEIPAIAEIGQLVLRLPRSGDSDTALLIRLLASIGRVMNGEQAALRAEDLSRADALEDPELQLWAGGIAWGLGDYALGRRLRARAVTRYRTLGAAGPLASALDVLVTDEILQGHYALAEAYAEEGRRLALEAGRRNTACLHLASLAQVAALRGREQPARRLAAEVLIEATARGLGKAADTAHLALGSLALIAGRAEDALFEYGMLYGSGTVPVQYGVALHAIPDQVEAAVRAGRPEECRERATAYLAWADTVGSAELRALAARSRALLSSGDEAQGAFQEALRLHAVSDRPFEQAHTQLLYGELLRRQRRRVEARVQLRAALEAFERLGAALWAGRAVTELRATGESARRRDPSTLDQLTPQELHVARLIGQGATNREAAAHLFLSPRTVDYHLRKVFRKLNINSRSELIRLVLAGDPHVGTTGGSSSPSTAS
jgi:DNA-binding CsgD family transcriptional regulator